MLPPEGGFTAPIPLSILAAVAFVVVHVSVAVCPDVMLVGEAVRVAVGGACPPITVTIACAVTVPPGPFTVRVYVVVVEGCTVMLPPDTGWTAPIPLSMLADVAFVVDQVRVAVCPWLMLLGDAVRLAVGGDCPVPTVTIACAVIVPPGPVAVRVYVVLAEGCTVMLPPDTGWTAPIPLSMLADVAFVVDQVRVALCPDMMLVGDAVSVAVGALCVPPPPLPPLSVPLPAPHAVISASAKIISAYQKTVFGPNTWVMSENLQLLRRVELQQMLLASWIPVTLRPELDPGE